MSDRTLAHSPRGFTLLVCAALALVAAHPAAAQCPASTIICLNDQAFPNGGTTNTSNPTFNASCEGLILNDAGASFDIPSGKFEAYVSEGGNIDLWLRDAFTVTGPPPGTPIALHLRVRIKGSENWAGGCCPDSQARVQIKPLEPHTGDPSPVWSFGMSGLPYNPFSFADSLDFTLQRTVGAPVGIEIHASSLLGGPSSTDIIGQFTFLDLPPGSTVTSCKGYAQGQPVAALPMSWGRVKVIYR